MEISLDPELQALTDAAAALEAPHGADIPIEMLRAGYVMISQQNSLQDVECASIEPLEIPGPAGPLPARVYVPRNAPSGPLPTLVYFHGGGFMIGDLDSHDSPCRQLCNDAGVRVIAIDYRLAPEHKFPAAVEDCCAATEWILDNADALGVDADRVAVGGDSAGGNLSAVVSNHFAASGRQRLAFQLLIYPATDRTVDTPSMTALKDAGVTLDTRILDYFNDGYFGGTGAETTDPRLSPAKSGHLAKAPPAAVITAEYDPLRDEGEAYAKLLQAAGVRASYRCHEGLMHDFIMQTAVVRAARAAMVEMAADLKAALAGRAGA